MTRSKAIKAHCFDCAGDSNKEVTLCCAFDCPLWEHRTGQSLASSVYRKRMEVARKNYAEELSAMAADGIETARFWKFQSIKSASGGRKSRKPPVAMHN